MQEDSNHPINKPWNKPSDIGYRANAGRKIARSEWTHAPFLVAAIRTMREVIPRSSKLNINDYGIGLSSWIIYRMCRHESTIHYDSNPAWALFHSFLPHESVEWGIPQSFDYRDVAELDFIDCEGDRLALATSCGAVSSTVLIHDTADGPHTIKTKNGTVIPCKFSVGVHNEIPTFIMSAYAMEIVNLADQNETMDLAMQFVGEYSSWLEYHKRA